MREATGYAPGRVNLIGEHTDYNDGLVLPIALELGVTVRAGERDDDLVRLGTDADVGPGAVSYRIGDETPDRSWGDRVRGITAALRDRGIAIGGFTAEIASDLPAGAGLGSSAALAVAVLRALGDLFDLGFGDRDLVDLANAVENGPFVGARAGLLDQLASVYGRPDAGLRIDLRDRSTVMIPLPSDLELVVIDSGTRHAHATSGYNRRRAECEEAGRHLGVASLRDLEGREIFSIIERLVPPLDRRVRHVLTENERVRETVAALQAGDLPRVGRLLDESHRSLRDDYEVSTAELDRLVAVARSDPEVLGARLVGGGFGGSIIALTRRGRALQAAHRVVNEYRGGRLVAVVP